MQAIVDLHVAEPEGFGLQDCKITKLQACRVITLRKQTLRGLIEAPFYLESCNLAISHLLILNLLEQLLRFLPELVVVLVFRWEGGNFSQLLLRFIELIELCIIARGV